MNIRKIVTDLTTVRKTCTCYAFLTALFAVGIVVSNVCAAKVCSAFVFEFDAGILAYPITFLCIDLINEVFGPKNAAKTVLIGVCFEILALLLFMSAIHLPASPYVTEFAQQFETVIWTGGRVAIASVISYLVSQLLDVQLFKMFKLKFKAKWIRTSGSSLIAQMADSTVFTIVAFAGVIPDLGVMILTSFMVKALTTVLEVPFFYFFTRKVKQ